MNWLIKKDYRYATRHEDCYNVVPSCIFDHGRHELPFSGGKQALRRNDFFGPVKEYINNEMSVHAILRVDAAMTGR